MFRRFRFSRPSLPADNLQSQSIVAGLPGFFRTPSSPGLILGIAFFAVILLMTIVVGTALVRMEEMHRELEVIVEENNVKIELVNRMRAIVRDRMVAMNVMVLEQDPFKRDDVHLRYMALANKFIDARGRLEEMAASSKEKEGLQKLRQLTLWATPFNESIVDALLIDDLETARIQLLNQALPAQLQVVAQIEHLLTLYAEQAHQAEVRTHSTYRQASLLIGVLGGIALIISVLISMKVVRRVARDRASLTAEIAERTRIGIALREARDNLESKVEARTAELRQSRDRLTEAQRIGRMWYWELDEEADEMRWGELAQDLFLDEQLPATRQTFLNRIHPEDREIVERALETAEHEQQGLSIDHRILVRDGTLRVVNEKIETMPGRNGGGRILLGTIQDITERKAVEEQLMLAAKVFESSSEAIIIANVDGVIVDVNLAFSEITGFSREEAQGKAWQFLISDRHDEAFHSELSETLGTSGLWCGEIWGSSKSGEVKPRWFTINAIAGGIGKIVHYVSIFRDISAFKDKEEHLWHIAHHDPLCGLPNRKLMLEQLKDAISRADQENKRVALMLLDLDGFKKINDTFGHNTGDELLIHVAHMLNSSIRIESDTVARLAGDEFVVIVGDIDSKSQAAVVAEKILHHLEEPLGGQQKAVITAAASIGIAIYPEDSIDPSILLKAADSAMYQAKARGKKNYCFYDTLIETEKMESA